MKKVRFEPERVNTQENRAKRKSFVEQALMHQADNFPICAMDKSNYNIHISRTNGHFTGTRYTTVVAGSTRYNVHVIGCISNAGQLQ